MKLEKKRRNKDHLQFKSQLPDVLQVELLRVSLGSVLVLSNEIRVLALGQDSSVIGVSASRTCS